MPNLLLDLPTEILLQLLSFLPAVDLESCQLVNQHFRSLISNSSQLKYLIAIGNAGYEDNPSCKAFDLPQRLEMITQRELSLRAFRPDFAQRIKVPIMPSGIYDFTNGIYLIGALNRRSFSYINLPTMQRDVVTWSSINTDRPIIDLGLAIYENDLVAIVTKGPHPDTTTLLPPRYHIELSLLSFSTGKPHPLARNQKIPIEVSRLPKPSISIEIVGDYVALATTHINNPFRPQDRFYVWNWKTGELFIDVRAPCRTYTGIIFLTPDLLLLPNIIAGTFEYWRIPSSPHEKPTAPIHKIALPPLERQIGGISCRGEPNPAGLGSVLHSNRPFHSSASSAIIIFHIYIQPTLALPNCTMTLMIHRQSLVDILNSHLSTPSLGEAQPLPWTEWGPPVSRWFLADNMPTRWITSTAGQRCACIAHITALQISSTITIYDFNPVNVARAKNYIKCYSNHRLFCDNGEEQFEDPHGVFSVPVYSGLPYYGFESEEEFKYHGILMDDERLLGIKVDAWDRVTSIDILHFG